MLSYKKHKMMCILEFGRVEPARIAERTLFFYGTITVLFSEQDAEMHTGE
jgi:hypothetical protein